MKPSRQFIIAAILAALLLGVAVLLAGNAARTLWLRAHRYSARSANPDGVPGSNPAGDPDGDPVLAAQADDAAALKAAEPIDPAMIGYHEEGTFAVDLREPRALAVDTKGDIYVGGDRSVQRYSSEGKKLAVIALEGEPRCLAVGSPEHARPGHIYVGMEDHVEDYEIRGARSAVWKSPRQNTVFTSITTIENEVWVADRGNRLVWRYDLEGHTLKPVGQDDPQHRTGFLVTNHYFDLVAGADDLVYVVNPRLMRVEGFTHQGQYETAWGQGSPSVKDFFGCCNPAHLAVLPDGRFVTAEKGMPRVKIYARDGTFETVVAGSSQLSDTPTDLATDPLGRVLVLDGRAAKVRVFLANPSHKEKAK